MKLSKIIIWLIPVSIIILVVINYGRLFYADLASCEYKYISDNTATGHSHLLSQSYNLIDIARALSKSGNYTGTLFSIYPASKSVQYDFKTLANDQKYPAIDTIGSQVSFSRKYGTAVYNLFIQSTTAGVTLGAFMTKEGSESCSTPDPDIKAKIDQILKDMNLTRAQYQELSKAIKVEKYHHSNFIL